MSWRVALVLALSLTPLLARAQTAAEPPAPAPAPTEALDRVVKEQISADDAARASQEVIDQLDDETQKTAGRIPPGGRRRGELHDLHEATGGAGRLAERRDESMQQQLVEIETTQREVLPMMEQMLETLERFVALDLPFLLDERSESRREAEGDDGPRRRHDLREVPSHRRGVSDRDGLRPHDRSLRGEARRRRRRAHRPVPARRARGADVSDAGRQGDRLLGRDAKSWVVDNDYAHSFKEGIAVAKKTRAPELLRFPVPAPREDKLRRSASSLRSRLSRGAARHARRARRRQPRRAARADAHGRARPGKRGERGARAGVPGRSRRSRRACSPKPSASATRPRRGARSPRPSTPTR